MTRRKSSLPKVFCTKNERQIYELRPNRRMFSNIACLFQIYATKAFPRVIDKSGTLVAGIIRKDVKPRGQLERAQAHRVYPQDHYTIRSRRRVSQYPPCNGSAGEDQVSTFPCGEWRTSIPIEKKASHEKITGKVLKLFN